MEKLISRIGHYGACAAAVPGYELLVAFFRAHRRLAELASVRHFFAGRLRLDFDAADLADHPVDGLGRMESTGAVAVGN